MRRTDRSSWFCRCVCVWRGRVSKCTIPALSTQPFIHVVGQVGRLWESPLDAWSVRERCVASRSEPVPRALQAACAFLRGLRQHFFCNHSHAARCDPESSRPTHTHTPVGDYFAIVDLGPAAGEREHSLKIYRSPLGGTLFDTR
jgi:hypothetical protein